MKTIFITEKPSVAQEYVKVLKIKKEGQTDGYVEGFSSVLNTFVQITWAVGHLITLGSVDEQRVQRDLGNKKPSTQQESSEKQMPDEKKAFNKMAMLAKAIKESE